MPGNDTDNQSTDTEPTQADAFALVGHEIRAEILRVLGDQGFDDPVSLGELRSRLSIDVEPSQLHYHVQQLVGHFVEQSDAGYNFRPAGARLVLALRSGTFDRQQDTMTCNAGFDCDYCETPVEARLDHGWVEIECPLCDYSYFSYPLIYIPLQTFEDEIAAFSHFREYMAFNNLFLARGICPNCGHGLDTELFADDDHPGDNKVCIDQSCTECGIGWGLSVGEVLRADPGLIGFCHEHNVDVLSTPHWELEPVLSDDNVTIRSTDPWEIALAVTFDGDTLELVIDGDLNVVERNRLDSSATESTSLLHGIQNDAYSMASQRTVDMVILPDNADCVEYLRRHRWPDGVTCPHCDSPNIIKKGMSRKDAQCYQCQDCGVNFNDLTGTMFAEHHLTLPEMFYIIGQMDQTETAQIARQLDRSHQAVANFMRKVQDAFKENPKSVSQVTE